MQIKKFLNCKIKNIQSAFLISYQTQEFENISTL